jgi:cell wall assembly regulator SMI1
MSADKILVRRGRVLGVLVLAAGLGATKLPAANGERAPGRPWVARRITEETLGFANPAGVVYSPRAHAFFVSPAEGPSRLKGVTHMAEAAGMTTLDLAGADALNLSFDGHHGRLLTLSGNRWLLAVAADGSGGLRRNVSARYDIRHLGLGKPAGLAVDQRTGTLYLLDAAIPRLVRAEPTADGGFDAAAVSYVELNAIPADGLKGLAFDSGTDHLFLSSGPQTLYEMSAAGELLATHDISQARLKSPGGMVVAPTGDQTDDPSAQSVYIADEGTRSTSGAIVELTFAPTATAQAVTTFTSSVVTQTLTSQWSPPAPDTSDVVYLPASNTLLVVDSEVEEMSIWHGANEWEATLTGSVVDTSNLAKPPQGPGFTNEPTGISVNPANRHLFYSDDQQKKVFEINPGPDGQYHTSDDVITSFSTSAFGSSDPEDVTYAPGENVLYLTDGVNREVYRIAPGPNGVFNGVPSAGDDQMTHFDVSNIVTDPECLTYDTQNGHLYIGGNNDDLIQEISTTGTLLQAINIAAANAFHIGGIGFGPGSDNPNAKRLYVVQRGVDNDSSRSENDGKLWQMTLPSGGPINQAPTVNAGPNQTITLPSMVSLDGTVSDDGLPTPPNLTQMWSKLSGPGTVTFFPASAVDTTASFSASGTYVLRLTANDGALSASDDIQVQVNPASGGNQPPSVDAGSDQLVVLPGPAVLDGTVSDDGLPAPPSLSTQWTKVSGPGTVQFVDASLVDTTATFSDVGNYVLRLTANDGAASTSDDVAVSVTNPGGGGTLSVVKRGTIHDSVDGSSFAFAPITASNSKLYLVFLSTSTGTAPAPSATSVSGAGLTFTEIGGPGGVLYSGSIGLRRIQAWRALSSSGGTGSIAINLSGTSTSLDAVLLEFSGVDTSGTNGSGAVAQSATAKVSSVTSISVALTPFSHPDNRPVAFFNHRVDEATTHEAGYTELDDATHTAPLAGAECEWHAGAAENTPSASWATAAAAGGFAIEIRAGAGP